MSEPEGSFSAFLEGLEAALEGAFFAFGSFFSVGSSPLPAFFGFSGESFHKTLTYTHDVRTRTPQWRVGDTYSGHGILSALSRIGFSPDGELCLYK